MIRKAQIEELRGKTIVEVKGMNQYSAQVELVTDDGLTFVLYHLQDCCERVCLEDIAGDPEDLLGEIKMAEKNSNSEIGEWGDSMTWTFYRLATHKGLVVLRWLGQSNGYYSEGVDIVVHDGKDLPKGSPQSWW